VEFILTAAWERYRADSMRLELEGAYKFPFRLDGTSAVSNPRNRIAFGIGFPLPLV
jgi:hypothetical protein